MQPQMLQTIHMMTFERASTEKLHPGMLQTIPPTFILNVLGRGGCAPGYCRPFVQGSLRVLRRGGCALAPWLPDDDDEY